MQVTFNTKRLYTAEGQIITARYDAADEMIYFTDHSRMIHDQQITCALPPRDTEELARKTMRAYDNIRFTYAPFEKRVKRDEAAPVLEVRL